MHKRNSTGLRLELSRPQIDYIVKLLAKQRYSDVVVLMQEISNQLHPQIYGAPPSADK